MADSEIWGLTAETEVESTCRIPLQTNTGVDALYATAALLGGLQVSNQTVTTANITGAVGKLYVCTIAGLTAARDLTLPSAQVGERVGVYIVDGDATYELVIKGAASQTINGGSAATEWSRLFIQGECCVFRCVAANTWIVEFDGRIPCKAIMNMTTAITTSTTGYEQVDLDIQTYDVGNICNTGSTRVDIRRSGAYLLSAGTSNQVATGGDGNNYQCIIGYGATPTYIASCAVWPPSSTGGQMPNVSFLHQGAAGSYYTLYFKCTESNKGCSNLTDRTYLNVVEVLR